MTAPSPRPAEPPPTASDDTDPAAPYGTVRPDPAAARARIVPLPAGPSIRVMTWNLQGSKGIDTPMIADVVAAAEPDVVVLQEVQRRQASRLSRTLAMPGYRWIFKHRPLIARAEGLAILTRFQLVDAYSFVVRRALWFDWRRRVALEVLVVVDGTQFRVIDVHLSPHDEDERRAREARTVVDHAGTRTPRPMICGDLNALPGTAGHAAIVRSGWLDAWTAAGGADDGGATNWTAGERAGRQPTQRLDYVLVPRDWAVDSCRVVGADAGVDVLDDFAELSDHLPVLADVRLP